MDDWNLNYYKHYIGDFQRDTSHLSLTERGAYLALIHHYYATETPLPNDWMALCRIAGAMTKPEQVAVKSVMSFFTPMDSGLVSTRIEAELEKHDDRADKNTQIALAREARRRATKQQKRDHETSTNRAQNVHEQSTNVTPIPVSSNQKPISVPIGTGAVAPRDPVKDELWTLGKQLLVEKSGMTKAQAGDIIGKLVKDHSVARVLDAVRYCIRESIADPKTYLLAMKREDGKIAALERANDDAVAQFLKEASHA